MNLAIPRKNKTIVDVEIDKKGVYIETLTLERDHNFVPQTLELSVEEMDRICQEWMTFRQSN